MQEPAAPGGGEERSALDQVILGIAHELNNPNAYVRLNTANLRKMFRLLAPCLEEYEAGHPEARFGPYTLAEIRANMERHLSAILDATTRISVIGGKLRQCTEESLVDESRVSLREVVLSSLSSHAFLFARCADITADYDEDDAYEVEGFRLQLEQAVSVLLTNAYAAIVARHGEDGDVRGQIRVALQRASDAILLRIADDGCGMDSHTRDNAFVPYFTTKELGGGEGIGLAICRAVVLRHGGTIALNSEVERGTEFIVKLPVGGNDHRP
jgi:signal transduction histidine kinase